MAREKEVAAASCGPDAHVHVTQAVPIASLAALQAQLQQATRKPSSGVRFAPSAPLRVRKAAPSDADGPSDGGSNVSSCKGSNAGGQQLPTSFIDIPMHTYNPATDTPAEKCALIEVAKLSAPNAVLCNCTVELLDGLALQVEGGITFENVTFVGSNTIGLVLSHNTTDISFKSCTFVLMRTVVCNRAAAHFERCTFTSTEGTALHVLHATVHLANCELRAAALALAVAARGKAVCNGCTVHRCNAAITVWHSGELVCEADTSVSDCSERGVTVAGEGATACLSSTSIDRCCAAGLLLRGGARGLLRSTTVTQSAASKAVPGCGGAASGAGMVLLDNGTHVRAEQSKFASNAGPGVYVEGGDLSAEDCELRDNAGRCICSARAAFSTDARPVPVSLKKCVLAQSGRGHPVAADGKPVNALELKLDCGSKGFDMSDCLVNGIAVP